MGGQLLADHWLTVKHGPLPGAEDVTAEAFAELLTLPQKPLSSDPWVIKRPMGITGDAYYCFLGSKLVNYSTTFSE